MFPLRCLLLGGFLLWLGLLIAGCQLGELDNPRDPGNQVARLRATAGDDRQISVTWERPANPRFGSFLVVATGPQGWVRQVETRDASCEFSRLLPNQIYVFSVRARGPTGALSQEVETYAKARDATAPSEVTGLTGALGDAGTGRLTWTVPADTDLARILVHWAPVGGAQEGSLDLPPGTHEASVRNLKPSAAYEFTVQTEDDQLNLSRGSSVLLLGVPLATIPGGLVTFGGGTATVSSFQMARFEVTQSLYQAVTGRNNSFFRNGVEGAFLPVEQVTWYEAAAFCNALSALQGRDQVYSIGVRGLTSDVTKNGFRLPTEAEWILAAQDAMVKPPYRFAGGNDITLVGWLLDNALSATHRVGEKQPNALGIYDLSGNVWEWCWDWFGPLPSADTVNPKGPAEGTGKVARGGSYADGSEWAQVGRRFSFLPGSTTTGLGIRLVCGLEDQR